MEEIKVGEYIRYDDGTLIKVIEEEHSYYNYLFKNKKGIFKHSSNIIDLIEEGDYVNERYVVCVEKHKNRIIVEVNYGKCGLKELKPKDIKSIVTKEQFEQMKYILGDESNG